MKKLLYTVLAGIFVVGPLFGLMLYAFEEKMPVKNIIISSVIFGMGMALGEIFIFEKIRNRKKRT